jgi:hypothetical protein
VEAPSRPPIRRTLTPAVLLATAFTGACIVLSIAFVAAHGGLEVPQLVAAASTGPTAAPSLQPATAAPGTAEPTATSPVITVPPPQLTLPPPTPAPTPTPNPITLLPRCPGFVGCWEYTVKRGDTLSEIASHYLLPVSLLEWLNPQITDPSTIVLGQIVYLGFDGYARLQPCSDQAGCYLYVIRPGDRLSTIAGHLGITTQAIVDFDPNITDANTIFSGETIRVPGPIQCCG